MPRETHAIDCDLDEDCSCRRNRSTATSYLTPAQISALREIRDLGADATPYGSRARTYRTLVSRGLISFRTTDPFQAGYRVFWRTIYFLTPAGEEALREIEVRRPS